MLSIPVKAEVSYDVIVGCDWKESLGEISRAHKKILLVAPASIVELGKLDVLLDSSQHSLFVTPDAEEQKDVATLERIWSTLGSLEFGRTDAIVAIGGGATTDLGGFAAATWLRGIAWYAIPTTLAGMVDASVGGKTGINTQAGKNLVGSFYSPKSVFIDTAWLATLSDRDFSAGLAEVIKTGFIRDTSILDDLEVAGDILGARSISETLIAKSVTVKADVVSSDFKEGKLREILNFGHTLGHAIEKSAGYSLRHGEAVAVGLHFASLLSEELLHLQSDSTERLKNLLERFNLPTTVTDGQYQWDELYQSMAGDKKSRDGRIRFIGLRAPGEPDWIETASADQLLKSYERIVK